LRSLWDSEASEREDSDFLLLTTGTKIFQRIREKVRFSKTNKEDCLPDPYRSNGPSTGGRQTCGKSNHGGKGREKILGGRGHAMRAREEKKGDSCATLRHQEEGFPKGFHGVGKHPGRGEMRGKKRYQNIVSWNCDREPKR